MSGEKLNPVLLAVQANREEDPLKANRLIVKSLSIMFKTKGDLGMCSHLHALILGGCDGYKKIISSMENLPED